MQEWKGGLFLTLTVRSSHGSQNWKLVPGFHPKFSILHLPTTSSSTHFPRLLRSTWKIRLQYIATKSFTGPSKSNLQNSNNVAYHWAPASGTLFINYLLLHVLLTDPPQAIYLYLLTDYSTLGIVLPWFSPDWARILPHIVNSQSHGFWMTSPRKPIFRVEQRQNPYLACCLPGRVSACNKRILITCSIILMLWLL